VKARGERRGTDVMWMVARKCTGRARGADERGAKVTHLLGRGGGRKQASRQRSRSPGRCFYHGPAHAVELALLEFIKENYGTVLRRACHGPANVTGDVTQV